MAILTGNKMSDENIKKVYVINLDNKRVILLTGLFFFLFSISFLAGFKWDENNVQNLKNVQNVENTAISMNGVKDIEENHLLASGNAGQEKNILVLPEEDNRIFSQKKKITTDDPFIIEPPAHSTDKKEPVQSSAKKTSEEVSKKEMIASKTLEKYYTIQIAAFTHEKDAISYQDQIKKKNIDSRIDKSSKYYYVRSGKSKDKAQLQSLLKKINNVLNLQAIVVQKKIS